MKIDGSEFGAVTIDGTTYAHDVIIRLSGAVEKRKKKLSKKYYGTSHVISKDEAKFVFEKGCDLLVIGTGHEGNVHLSPEASGFFKKKGCEVTLQPTPKAIKSFQPGQGSQDRTYPRDVLKRSRSVVLALDALEIVQAPMLFGGLVDTCGKPGLGFARSIAAMRAWGRQTAPRRHRQCACRAIAASALHHCRTGRHRQDHRYPGCGRGGAHRVIVRDWAEGFMRGVATHVDAWSVILLMDKRKLLAPILAASTAGQD